MTIFYRLGNKLYVNITNTCPCACVFCIRNFTDTVGDAKSLWLEHEPTLAEVRQAFDARQDLHEIDEIVFCGYGEPMMRADDVIKMSQYMKEKTSLPVRVNTNGLIKCISPTFDVSRLIAVDSISVSLNADDAEEYLRIVRPTFGLQSHDALLEFVEEVKKFTNVTLTVMDSIGAERIVNCQKIASDLGVELRVREYM